jgi:hypothetical protein
MEFLGDGFKNIDRDGHGFMGQYRRRAEQPSSWSELKMEEME